MNRKRDPYYRIKAFLVEHDIKQNEVAALFNVKANTISKKLNGFGGDFTLSEAKTMHQELGVPVAYFFEPSVPKKERREIS